LPLHYTGDWFWAEYGTFIVDSETTNYLLTVGKFSGNTGDMLSYHNGHTVTVTTTSGTTSDTATGAPY